VSIVSTMWFSKNQAKRNYRIDHIYSQFDR